MWVFDKIQDTYKVGYVVGNKVKFVMEVLDRAEAMQLVNYLNGGKGA